MTFAAGFAYGVMALLMMLLHLGFVAMEDWDE